MKTLLLTLTLLGSGAWAQVVHPAVTVGPNAPSASACQALTTGDIYVRSEDPANGPAEVLRCTQTGALSYAWQPIDHFVGASLPGTCSDGAFALQTGAAQNLYLCKSNAWAAAAGWTDDGATLTAITGRTVSVPATGVLSTPNVVFSGITLLAPATSSPGRIFRYTHDSVTGACSGTGTASSLCYSDGTTWSALVVGPGTFVTASDPGCTTTGHVGKLWFDTTTTTTAIKACVNVSGTVGWSVITATP